MLAWSSRDGAQCVVPGRARGVLLGGTLSLLAMTIGTAESRPANGAIVVLEDVGEVGYRLDNKLTQLLRTGWFDGVQGIVLGSWADCGPDGEATVVARLRELGVPMVAGLPIGHGAHGPDGAARRRGRAGRRRRHPDVAHRPPHLSLQQKSIMHYLGARAHK